MSKVLTLKEAKSPAIEIHRQAIKAKKLVYLVVMNKAIKYPHGRSKIAYIGTTASGIDRIASSGAARAKNLLLEHGQKGLKLFVVTCSTRQGLKSGERKLEAALILNFKREFGQVLKGNTQGKNVSKTAASQWFSEARLRKVIENYS